MSSYNGRCFCGEVEITVEGEPAAMGFCHCESCRSWAAAPINAFILWKSNQVQVTKGEGNLGTYNKTERSYRQFCKSCGGHVMTKHPAWDLIDVYSATIPTFPFQPGVHVHYQETVVRMKDGLPKMKDLPGEMGGSGEVVAE
ncbi:MAG TPA: GFA family protein [Kofleriaceae bacterium]|nr:GFA family protein [Kofleriaceae bacterium]